jgi:DNA-binding GntR family transcriptional regulator
MPTRLDRPGSPTAVTFAMVSVATEAMPMTDEPLPFDLKLAREVFASDTNSHPAIVAALREGDGETAAELVEASFSSAGEELAAVVERSGPE